MSKFNTFWLRWAIEKVDIFDTSIRGYRMLYATKIYFVRNYKSVNSFYTLGNVVGSMVFYTTHSFPLH